MGFLDHETKQQDTPPTTYTHFWSKEKEREEKLVDLLGAAAVVAAASAAASNWIWQTTLAQLMTRADKHQRNRDIRRS